MRIFLLIIFSAFQLLCVAQMSSDTSMQVGKHYITLSPVIIDSKMNVGSLIQQIRSDSTFYKAFKNLRIIGYTAINDIKMLNGRGVPEASLHSKTIQYRKHDCRFMQILEEQVTGDFYNEDHQFNYYTAQMYSSLFFTKDSVCHETNMVGNSNFSTSGKSGMVKHKEQLKMLFFNPGKRINGLPFMSNKTAIYDDDMADAYDMSVDRDFFNKTSCIIFRQKVKPGMEDRVVIDEMTTWFDDSTHEVVARNYSLSYDAGVYDFKVNMEVQMTHYNGLLVPALIRYYGNWKAIFKKRERGAFTATLFDFK